MTAKTVFLSHSSKDIDKVRKIRDILEALEFEPLLFHMKCLDDDNDLLEDFIKKEIDARNVFVYCRSRNSEDSVWVQRELEYIRTSGNKRLYSIDIEKPLRETLVTFLQTLARIVQRNKVFISASHSDRAVSDRIAGILEDAGYDVIRYNTFEKSKVGQHDEDLRDIARNGIFLPIISSRFLKSVYCVSELEKVLYFSDPDSGPLCRPVYLMPPSVAAHFLPGSVSVLQSLYIESEAQLDSEEKMNELIEFMQIDG